jgi:hypothetical protein
MEVADTIAISGGLVGGGLGGRNLHEDSGYTEESSDLTSSAGSRGNNQTNIHNGRTRNRRQQQQAQVKDK